MQKEIIKIEANNLEEVYEFGEIARQASGAVLYRCGKAVLIGAIAIEEKLLDEDFLPLTVQYIEKSYAGAKIPGGFIKRETKPSDFETLTSRIIDRSIRPLFPEGFNYEIVLTVMVVSSDLEVDMQVAALHTANATLFSSDIPVNSSIGAARIGKIDGQIILNPTNSELERSSLDLLVVGKDRDIMMIEMRTMATKKVDIEEVSMLDPISGAMPLAIEHQEANELPPHELVEIIDYASHAIYVATDKFKDQFKDVVKPKLDLPLATQNFDHELYNKVVNDFADEIKAAVQHMAKSERSMELKKVVDSVMSKYELDDRKNAVHVVEHYKREIVRDLILNQGIRADGRRLDEVRPISIRTNILPNVHGSCLFTRGQTQALVTVTLGDNKDAQSYELITSNETQYEKLMVHYNFPGFSVGEAKFQGAPGRRELGHGNLAKRALESSFDMDYDGSVRIVSEILESNGSSSMATVCGGSLALRAAQVDCTTLVAGVAMGVVVQDERYAVLTDIMGLEDHDGDMDFKICGTRYGITALQLDIKLGGIKLEILKDVLTQATRAQAEILEKMEDAGANIIKSDALPATEFFHIDPSRISEVIGKAGSTIKEIIEKFDVAIDIKRDVGGVKVSGATQANVIGAKQHIQTIISNEPKKQSTYEINKEYIGKIKKIVDFGMFIEMPDGFDALLHISKVAKHRVDNLEELYRVGDDITVIVLEQKGKKVELATPAYLDEE
ncbi:MAG: polyribonucleotide nucleotidyltransferase [Campylobacterales bacterium]|nr:polyribonucleotide nucleotidyltransferase [Campylobacterales bacterium]